MVTARKLRTLEFKNICRICLNEEKEMRNFNKHIISMITACASITINSDDGLPTSICNRCYHQFTRFFSFKNRVERNEIKLKKVLIERTKIKKSAKLTKTKNIANEINADELDENSTKSHYQTQSITKREIAENENDSNKIQIKEIGLLVRKDDPIFLNEPPPLVPLIPTVNEEKSSDQTSLEKQIEMTILSLPDETPPLIPLKPTPPLVPIKTLTTFDALSTAMANSNIIAATFSCPNCTEEFTDPVELKAHATKAHSTISTLICNICKKEFADRHRLIGHLKGHTIQKLYACKICGKRYPNPSTFKVHMRTHTGERPFKCQICNKGFVRWAGVVGHMKSHNEAKPYQCEICQRGFKMQSNLERHKILHTGEMPFCCSYCGKTFTQNDNLQLHVRTYHTNERPYLCNECGKSFVCSTRLKRHMWVHAGYKRYICQHCPKSYSNSNDLKIHNYRTHSGSGGDDQQEKPYACTVCDMRFFHPCRLQRHMRTHERPYSCSECSRTFSREEFLIKHVTKKHNSNHHNTFEINNIIEDDNFDNIDTNNDPKLLNETVKGDELVKIEFINIKSFNVNFKSIGSQQ